MNRAVRGVAWLALLILAGWLVYRFQLHPQERLVAVVPRGADAHREVSGSLDARLQRLFAGAPSAGAPPKLVALTFDDGPYPVTTPLLLDVLADLHVRATFFLVGEDAQTFPELARRIARDGHEIGNHTMTHPAHFEALDESAVRGELDEAAKTLETYSSDPGIRTLMRPPHGRYTEETVRAAQRDGYHFILWNDDPGDWRTTTPARLAEHVEKRATAPDIILLHSGKMTTIRMLPEIVQRFRAAGFDFVTVGELMRRVPVETIDHAEKMPV